MLFVMDISEELSYFLQCDVKWLISVGYNINVNDIGNDHCLICSQSIKHDNYVYHCNNTKIICEMCSSIINPINCHCVREVIYRLVIYDRGYGLKFSTNTYMHIEEWDWIEDHRDNIVDIVKTLVDRNNNVGPILFMMGICYDYESNVHMLVNDVSYHILRFIY